VIKYSIEAGVACNTCCAPKVSRRLGEVDGLLGVKDRVKEEWQETILNLENQLGCDGGNTKTSSAQCRRQDVLFGAPVIPSIGWLSTSSS